MIEKDNYIIMKLKDGDVHIQLFPEQAPNHVQRIKELVREGFYDGVSFHRVIDGFMAQTGDPTGTGMGGSDKPDLKAEFNDIKHVKGVVSMARSANPDSANSQFFIMLADAPHLDGQYTAFGTVTEGMQFVDNIKRGDPKQNGAVTDPDKIISMKIVADIQAQEIEDDLRANPLTPEEIEANAAAAVNSNVEQAVEDITASTPIRVNQ